MKIFVTSVFVDDQEKALKFYTEVLGFIKKTDITAGNYRWLAVVSPEGHPDIELLLASNETSAAKMYQKAIHDAGIPAAIFKVSDIQREYERLKARGVSFVMPPTKTGPSTTAIFEDTCGNLISITQQP